MAANELTAHLQSLSDSELLLRASGGGLTESVQRLAEQELASRGIALPDRPEEREQVEREYEGDMTIVAKYLTPTEAHMLCSCLNAAGIPADAGDTNTVQAYSLLSIAVGGARVRVPSAYETEALEIIAAYNRGDFALDESFDPDADAL
ncbi:hypothetical protein [Rhodoferax saidenbachensis]|uniref:DUF2007 domain-containing protein n=1 Tax=Rhodoferax saidenbachensis TaxID=1484693 RepID=A0ABU1ZKT6_9BURK|nr:hypothetical protein [Rhodoferax saidenbachensis]MDR7306154.1 hypothetical protein [Rhodoferax saidenbachensis]